MIEINKHCQLLLENGRCPANCFFRINRAIRFQINNQLVQVSPLFYSSVFNGVSHPANRAESGIQLQTANGTRFVFFKTALIRWLIPTTALNPQSHVYFTIITEVTDDVLRIGNLNVMIEFNIAGRDNTRALLAERKLSFVPAVHRDRDAFKIQKNLNDIFLDTLNGAVLVQNTVNLRFSYGAARHRRQKNATQRTAQGVTETSFQRLKRDLGACRTRFLYVNGTRCQ